MSEQTDTPNDQAAQEQARELVERAINTLREYPMILFPAWSAEPKVVELYKDILRARLAGDGEDRELLRECREALELQAKNTYYYNNGSMKKADEPSMAYPGHSRWYEYAREETRNALTKLNARLKGGE